MKKNKRALPVIIESGKGKSSRRFFRQLVRFFAEESRRYHLLLVIDLPGDFHF